MKLLNIDTFNQSQDKLWQHMNELNAGKVRLPLLELNQKVLAEDIYSEVNVPEFDRSSVDGYAVVSKDTAAAGESIPVILKKSGEVFMGERADFEIKSGECAYIPTGGMLPAGADAVVMVEYSESFGEGEVALYKAAGAGENVVTRGEDVKTGGLLFKNGTLMSPNAIAALAAIGKADVLVHGELTLTVISSGDELVPPGESLSTGQVYDINTYGLCALAKKNGFKVVDSMIVRDDESLMEHALKKAMQASDIVAISGGSSQGKKDKTSEVLDRISTPGVFTNGIAVKPGKPTILAYDNPSSTLLIGLPGHPVSAMLIFITLICRLYHKKQNRNAAPAIPAVLTANVHSSPGKLTCLPVKLSQSGGEMSATPVYGKSGLITTLSEADGFFEIEKDSEGVPKGETVRVHLF